MRKLTFLLIAILYSLSASAQGYSVGDKAIAFKLKNTDGKMVSVKDFSDAKGFIVVFTCNTCPYAVAYEDRLIDMNKKYKKKGFPLIAINPNDPDVQPDDTYELMVKKASKKGFNFPYLFDPGRKVSAVYGATKTPHIYLLSKKGDKLTVEYIGAIDDNYKDAAKVKKAYLANAIDALLSGKKPSVTYTKAIGCTVKKKKS